LYGETFKRALLRLRRKILVPSQKNQEHAIAKRPSVSNCTVIALLLALFVVNIIFILKDLNAAAKDAITTNPMFNNEIKSLTQFSKRTLMLSTERLLKNKPIAKLTQKYTIYLGLGLQL
jgi:hypothetical protein